MARLLLDISIPAFREEGDKLEIQDRLDAFRFQSPPSVRKATYIDTEVGKLRDISIPAFREEGDLVEGILFSATPHFNPRLP